jgi:hypothetical protein
MSPQQIEGLWICLAITLMTLTVSPLVVWGLGSRRA